ncbi:amidohydrolase family protein [Quadrisphaera sp. KR29]|uniref:amidohydrolase family protein n=1 Tax=Quadrisphaera sp. KR29 TaxID=3461391 RepID=UPI004043AC3C
MRADGPPQPVGVHGGSGGGGVQQPPAAPAPTAVDAHHHLWDPADPGQDWLARPEHEAIDRVFTAADLRAAGSEGVDGRPLGAAVVVQSVCTAAESRALLAAAAADPLLAGVVGWADLTGDVDAQLEALRAAPGGELLVGVRHLVQDEPDTAWLLREDVQRGLRALATHGLAFDLLVREPQRAAGVEAARRAAEHGLRTVLDHAGKPDVRRGAPAGALEAWERQVRALAAVPGTVCKASGLLSEVGGAGWDEAAVRRVLDVLLDAFGPGRVAFGSDWPVCLLTTSWRAWADLVAAHAAQLTAAEREALFGGTARAAYRLGAAPEALGLPARPTPPASTLETV